MSIPRYPITAWAMCNALGATTEVALERLLAGQSGLRPCTLDVPFSTFTGELPGELPPLPDSLSTCDTRQARVAAMTLAELKEPVGRAVEHWGPDRVAIVLGSSTGGIRHTEEAWGRMLADGTDVLPTDYRCLDQHVFSATARVVAALSGIRGPAYIVSTACTSSAKVLGSAQRLLAAGVVDAVVAGGVDTLCRFTIAGFRSLQVLSEAPCRPFSEARNGINIGEGGAFLLLEREGTPRAWLCGIGETSDAYHMTSPHPEGVGAIAAMEQAVERSGLTPDDIGWVNAHGTATRLND